MTATSDPDASTAGAAAATTTPVELRSWRMGIGPRLAASFLLIVFFDRLAVRTLVVGGLVPSLAGVALGAILAYVLLFGPASRLGWRSRRGLFDLAEGAFGTTGARRIVTPAVALVHASWFAVALYAGVDLSLRALASAGLIEAEALNPSRLLGWPCPGGVFQASVVAWIVPAAILGPMLVHLVAAVLFLYPIFSIAALLTALTWVSGDLGAAFSFDVPESGSEGIGQAFGNAAQHVFGFAAAAGLAAADWGAASRSGRDVKIGGRLGVMAAAIAVAAVALATIAAVLARPDLRLRPIYSDVLIVRIGGIAGGVLALIHSTALLGPCCYAPTGFLAAVRRAWAEAPRRVPTLLLFVASWPLVASGVAARHELIFPMIGAVVAPLLGVIVVRGDRPSRSGIDRGAVASWLAGWAAGVALLFVGGAPGPWPGPVAGFAAAALLARLLRPTDRASVASTDINPSS